VRTVGLEILENKLSEYVRLASQASPQDRCGWQRVG
jgi:hypothetical protein